MFNYNELKEMANDMERRAEAYTKKHKETMAKFDKEIEEISNRITENSQDIQGNLSRMEKLDKEFEEMNKALDELEKW